MLLVGFMLICRDRLSIPETSAAEVLQRTLRAQRGWGICLQRNAPSAEYTIQLLGRYKPRLRPRVASFSSSSPLQIQQRGCPTTRRCKRYRWWGWVRLPSTGSMAQSPPFFCGVRTVWGVAPLGASLKHVASNPLSTRERHSRGRLLQCVEVEGQNGWFAFKPPEKGTLKNTHMAGQPRPIQGNAAPN